MDEKLAPQLSSVIGVKQEQVISTMAKNLQIPIGRFAEPEEIANVIVFLASEKASYVAGLAICIDGGLTKSMI